jgi:hypothetical protein
MTEIYHPYGQDVFVAFQNTLAESRKTEDPCFFYHNGLVICVFKGKENTISFTDTITGGKNISYQKE